MFKNYLKVGIRSLVKQRVYSLINILGLSVGIASCALILLHVEDEYSYDKFHEKKDRIYTVTLERMYPNHSTYYAVIPHSFAEVMVNEFPEVRNATRMALVVGGQSIMVRYKKENGDQVAFEERLFQAADSNFFDMFSIELLKGDPETAISEPNSIVITQETAKKYFGNEDPINKTLNTDFGDYTVTGVCENVPENSHFDFDFLSSLSTFQFFRNLNYVSFSTYTYLELEEGASPDALEAKFPEMVTRYAAPQIEQRLNISYEQYTEAGNGYRYYLRPLTDIHLDPTNIEMKMKPGGNKTYVYIFISISIMILLIACINFMNLATARSAERAKEVGIRKTLGSFRKQLIGQFLIESLIISFISMLIALGIMYLILPYFNNLADKTLTLNLSGSLIIPGMLLFALIVGVLAGSYPAFVISSYSPVSVMKGGLHSSGTGSWLRNSLVIFQFAISIILIVGTIVVNNQMKYMQNKELGYNEEHLIFIPRAFVLDDKFETLKEDIKTLPGVVNAAGVTSVPGGFFNGIQFTPQGASEALTTKMAIMDDDFSETIGFKIIEGRDFSKDFNDSLSIILNEKAVETLGLTDPIGSKLENTINNPPNPPAIRTLTIIGIVKDFHFQSLRDEITPLVLFNSESAGPDFTPPVLSIRIKGDEMQNTIKQIENKWQAIAPEEPFKYQFLDDSLHAQYKNEKRSGQLFGIFASLAIIIACVGLFGLAAYTAGLRTKEIGVRKVMGASVSRIVIMLSMDFTKLIAIAFIIAAPVAWWGMNQWLENFYYRTSIGVEVFLISGISALLISWLTVSYQSIKAAIVNPVKSLRSE